MKIIVPDTGVLIDGRITQLAAREKAKVKVVVSKCVLAELEYQANAGRETGFTGLDELKKLGALAKEGKIDMEFAGERPSAIDVQGARFGEIDAKIRATAKSLGEHAILYTTDKVQAAVAEAENIAVEYLEPIVAPKATGLPFARFFDPGNVLSVHFKENCVPLAKAGKPGAFELLKADSREYSADEIEQMAKDAVEFSKREKKSYIEIDKKGALVVQAREYRVTFTKPPFSEGAELTVVKPLVKLSLSDYEISPSLLSRLEEKAEGIVIAGPPGSGKSTLASALAEDYAAKRKIVKTLEQPRDLQVGPEITQYAPLEGSFEAASDILLLVRPDYTIFDEVRKTVDFRVFADLRMAGIGMVGVVHAAKAIDAIQRFIGKIELGVIPQVVDTVIFIAKGRIAKTYSLSFVVRTPYGMMEKDLARPVIEIRDLDTNELEYEIYKYGEETVVISLAAARKGSKGGRRGASHGGDYEDETSRRVLSDKRIRKIISRYATNFEMEIEGNKLVLYVPEDQLARVIGKGGKRIADLEQQIGARVDVRAK